MNNLKRIFCKNIYDMAIGKENKVLKESWLNLRPIKRSIFFPPVQLCFLLLEQNLDKDGVGTRQVIMELSGKPQVQTPEKHTFNEMFGKIKQAKLYTTGLMTLWVQPHVFGFRVMRQQFVTELWQRCICVELKTRMEPWWQHLFCSCPATASSKSWATSSLFTKAVAALNHPRTKFLQVRELMESHRISAEKNQCFSNDLGF